MRLLHFCIGSLATQDLLISKSFLPQGKPPSSEEESDIQKVWALFLDLFQTQHHWTSSGVDSKSRTSSSSAAVTGEHARLQRPLYAQNCCFVYNTTNDIVLVACCPLPPTCSTASSTITRVPLSLPGQQQQQHSVSKPSSLVASPIASGILDSPTGMSHSDSIASLISSDIHSDTQGSTRTSHVAATPLSSSSSSSPTPGPVSQQQYQRPELAFSTAAGLHVSLHGTIEFLAQLVKALERYLLNNSGSSGSSGGNNDNSRAGPRRVSQTISSATAATSTNLPSSVSGLVLSAELIQLNVGIVYEVLDECMELGYPVMPSLAQLDLLVFGVAKTS